MVLNPKNLFILQIGSQLFDLYLIGMPIQTIFFDLVES